MQANYEQMVNAQQISMGHIETRIPDKKKFQIVIIVILNMYINNIFSLKFNLYVFN